MKLCETAPKKRAQTACKNVCGCTGALLPAGSVAQDFDDRPFGGVGECVLSALTKARGVLFLTAPQNGTKSAFQLVLMSCYLLLLMMF